MSVALDLPGRLAGLVGSAVAGREQPFLVALCGWADTGKSTIASSLRAALAEGGVAAESISTDDFMRDRAERNALGISGYDPRSLDVPGLQKAIDHFVRGEPFTVHPYDNRTGRKSAQPRMVAPARVLVVEGIHALHPAVSGHMDFKVFIDGDEQTLRQMRLRGNLQKRGLSAEAAAARISQEWMDYAASVQPRRAVADLVVGVDLDFTYRMHMKSP